MSYPFSHSFVLASIFSYHFSSRIQKRREKLERKTARVFFSSPFGGLEEEREELTKKYWPQLESMCNRAGYDFIPVDLRWGITSEMSSSAVTIKVCLNEMDRSDMIVGFFGQVCNVYRGGGEGARCKEGAILRVAKGLLRRLYFEGLPVVASL